MIVRPPLENLLCEQTRPRARTQLRMSSLRQYSFIYGAATRKQRREQKHINTKNNMQSNTTKPRSPAKQPCALQPNSNRSATPTAFTCRTIDEGAQEEKTEAEQNYMHGIPAVEVYGPARDLREDLHTPTRIVEIMGCGAAVSPPRCPLPDLRVDRSGPALDRRTILTHTSLVICVEAKRDFVVLQVRLKGHHGQLEVVPKTESAALTLISNLAMFLCDWLASERTRLLLGRDNLYPAPTSRVPSQHDFSSTRKASCACICVHLMCVHLRVCVFLYVSTD